MFRSLILAAVLLASAPLVANAGEITLLPSIKLQIGDRDDYGRYWDGGYWRDRDYWHRHYEWRKTAGGNTITAITVAGISVRPTSAATAKAGTIVTTAVAAGVTERQRPWSRPSPLTAKGASRLLFLLSLLLC